MATTILITGFGPFPGAPFNPTEALVGELARRRHLAFSDVRRVPHVFRVSYETVDRELPALLDREKPDALLMFGLATRSPGGSADRSACAQYNHVQRARCGWLRAGGGDHQRGCAGRIGAARAGATIGDSSPRRRYAGRAFAQRRRLSVQLPLLARRAGVQDRHAAPRYIRSRSSGTSRQRGKITAHAAHIRRSGRGRRRHPANRHRGNTREALTLYALTLSGRQQSKAPGPKFTLPIGSAVQ